MLARTIVSHGCVLARSKLHAYSVYSTYIFVGARCASCLLIFSPVILIILQSDSRTHHLIHVHEHVYVVYVHLFILRICARKRKTNVL